MAHSLVFLVALFICSLLVPLVRRYSLHLGLLDRPDQSRKAHSTEISRAGGIGIFVSALLALMMTSVNASAIAGLLSAGFVIFIFGLLDDAKNLNYRWKFIGQILAAIIAIHSGVLFERLPFFGIEPAPIGLSYIVTLLFLVGVTNAVNLSDGLDGLAGGSAFLSLGLIAVLAYFLNDHVVAVYAVAIMGAIAGFLRYNTHPATIFMGDSGSQFLGFMAACLAIMTTQGELSSYSAILPLLILGLPILDTLYVMFVRVKEGHSPFKADNSHLHHRLVRLGLRHDEAVAVFYIIQIALLSLAYVLRFDYDALLLVSYCTFCVALISSLIIAKRLQKGGGGNVDELVRERRNPVFRTIGKHFRTSTSLLSYAVVVVFAIAIASTLVVTIDTETTTLSVAVAMLLLAIYGFAQFNDNASARWLLRVVSSSAAAVVFYQASFVGLLSPWRYALDISLIFTLALLALCIRLSRKEVFSLTTQDLLIVLILIALQVLPIGEYFKYLIMRITIFVFIIEFLIAVGKPLHRLINIVSIASLFLVSFASAVLV